MTTGAPHGCIALIAASSAGDTLDGLVFIAPAEHSFGYYRADVDAMFDSARRGSAAQS